MADTPAILIAEPVDALRRAQQGKGYWKRVWERLLQSSPLLLVSDLIARRGTYQNPVDRIGYCLGSRRG